MSQRILGLDIGSNSVGSAWIDRATGSITVGTSIFPAGVDESDDKRGEPKNAKRRMTRRMRITLARRAARKRQLKLVLREADLLPKNEICEQCRTNDSCDENDQCFRRLLKTTDPWELRRRGLDEKLSPHEFGRVLLHLAQRRGALGLRISDPTESDTAESADDGKVKASIVEVQRKMKARTPKARTFGEFIAMLRDERVTAITSKDKRPQNRRNGPRQFRDAIRNKADSYEHCADREMIHREFSTLWDKQKSFDSPTANILTDELRLTLDNEQGDAIWRHKGLLFGQRRATWDLGTLGRCALEPTERCVPHADMYASRYLVVETINNLKIVERDKPSWPLTREERERIKTYLSGPLGKITSGKRKGDPKTTVTVSDLRNVMGTANDGWGRSSKKSLFHFNIEQRDEDRTINTDWFSREIVHGAITPELWEAIPDQLREGINRAILKYDPDHTDDAMALRTGVIKWGRLTEAQADALVTAWKQRPRPDRKRLNMSRRAVRNLLILMDRAEPWPDPDHPDQPRWITQIEARKLIAQDADFRDVTTGAPLDDLARRRYATGTKGATARDRYYMNKHVLRDSKGEPIVDPDGKPLAEPPPAPLISNPVVRKAIHEVRRHLVEYMTTFRCKPDEIYIELAREARMGKKDSDRQLFRGRLRNRIKRDIIREFQLESQSSTQQREAVKRVVLAMQQACVCPLCGGRVAEGEHDGITLRKAAEGEGCEIAHVLPRASGGDNRWSNIVLSHTKCNRDMRRRTPRQFWSDGKGFEQGMDWVQGIYGEVNRPNPSEVKNATGNSLWACYFTKRDDTAKIEQFKKDITDIQQMTARQDAATKYASRQIMAYLSDALYGGKGLPERSTGDDKRRIFTTEGLWTKRFCREWGLFFDPHNKKAKGLTADEEHKRREKDRGDHRHHAIDAVIIALSRDSKRKWEDRERQADRDGINTADEEQMDNYRRNNQLPVPPPFKSRKELQEAVRLAVFGERDNEKPICHRPVKRKLVGAFHKETLQGPVLDVWVRNDIIHRELVKERVTVRQRVLGQTQTDFLKPAHLRLPRPETDSEAIDRIARRMRIGKAGLSEKDALKTARKLVRSSGFTRAIVDPKPEKGGIVRDVGLRHLIRRRLEEWGLNPNKYSKTDLKRAIDKNGPLIMDSGVPIHRVVLLWSNREPVTIRRDEYDYSTGKRRKLDNPGSLRLYDSQNNHHIEIRVDAKGKWSGEVITAYKTAQRKLDRLRAFRAAGIPKPDEFRKLSRTERRKFRPTIRDIELAHPIVDRRDDDSKDGRFVMSLCEGEILHMRNKNTGDVGYFVVAKLNKPKRIVVVVPHWDARPAKLRKDADKKEIPDSKRESFDITPADIKTLAPRGQGHAAKVSVSPLGIVRELKGD